MISRGQRLRGSTEPVKCSSTLWIRDGADDSEFNLARVAVNPWC
jgi:hypothetical protein